MADAFGEDQELLETTTEKAPMAWESLPAYVRDRWLAQEGNTKERWESLTPYNQEEYFKMLDGEVPHKKSPAKNAWPGLPKRLRDIWIKESEQNTSERWISLDEETRKSVKIDLQKKFQLLESVPIPWENFEYRDLWTTEYETNSEATWAAIPADMQRKIVKRLKKSVMGESGGQRLGRGRAPVNWDTLDQELKDIYLKAQEGRNSDTWSEMTPKEQRKERDRLKRALAKVQKKQEQEMRKKARLTPELLNAWLSEERSLIEWLNLPTETKLHEMARLNTKLAKNSAMEGDKGIGGKRRRGRPFGATSSSKRAKAAAREALGETARDSFNTIAKFQEETRTAGVEKDNMMVLIQAFKGNLKKGRGRPRKDDLHNRLIFRVFGSTLNDMKMLLKQAYHQVKNELDILNNEAEINPQVKLAKHEILFNAADIERSFNNPPGSNQPPNASQTPATNSAEQQQNQQQTEQAQQQADQQQGGHVFLPQAPPQQLQGQAFTYEGAQEG